MIVFERELWAVSPLIPDGKTPTTYTFAGLFGKADAASGAASGKGDPAASKPAEKPSSGLKLWDGDGFDIHDVLDVINPLQHLPIISSIYRSEVKDEIGAVPRLLGSMLYGGGLIGAVVGVATALVNIVVEHETGKDLGQHIYTAIFGEGAGTRRTTQLAKPKAGAAAAALAAKPPESKSSGTEKTATPPATTNPVATARPAPGSRPISAKADAALQAFVAGLAKSASPAAAAAANAAITKRALRVTGTGLAAAANGKTGTATKGEISTQFRRSDWYQRNQAILKAQAAELAKQRAAAGKSGANGKSTAAILHLFTAPSGAAIKPVVKPTEKSGTATPAANAAPAHAAAGNRPTAKGPIVAGPWVANEIANGLSKYEALVKARKAATK